MGTTLEAVARGDDDVLFARPTREEAKDLASAERRRQWREAREAAVEAAGVRCWGHFSILAFVCTVALYHCINNRPLRPPIGTGGQCVSSGGAAAAVDGVVAA